MSELVAFDFGSDEHMRPLTCLRAITTSPADTDDYARQVEVDMKMGDARLSKGIAAIDADVRALDGHEDGDWRALSAALEAGE